MRKFDCLLIVLGTLVAMVAFQIGVTDAQQTTSLQVAASSICLDVVDRQPIDGGTIFPASVGKLYCYTQIIGASNPTEITHVWYFGNTERARVNLGVNSASWRTYSSKIIQSHEIGSWQVHVLGPGGEVLQTNEFTITQ